MRKIWIALAASVCAVSALGQTSPVIYAAVKSLKDQDVTLKSWGSGVVSETDEIAYEGTHSIRVSTRNLFQGMFLSLGKPVNLAEATKDKNNLLRLMVAFNSGTSMTGGSMPGGFGPGGYGPGGNRGGTRGGGGAGAGGVSMGGLMPGGAAPGEGGTTSAAKDNKIKNIRIIVATTDGKRSEAYVPVGYIPSKLGDFKAIAVPLQAISGFDKTNKVVQSIAVSGDAVATFFVGDIRVLNDSTPIMLDLSASSYNLALGEEITLTAIGSGGASVLEYSWDFNSADGVQKDAEGAALRRKFRKPGKFTITCTASDKFGLKAPITKTIEIEVNP